MFIFIEGCHCPGSSEKKSLPVTAIINGNTIQLKNDIQVVLLGVDDQQNCYDYLRSNLLGKNVSFFYDRKAKSPSSKKQNIYYAYVLNEERICINSDMIKRGITGFNSAYVSDSLAAIEGYSKTSGNVSANSVSGTGPSNGTKSSLKDIIKKSEPCIFVVYAVDGNNPNYFQGTGFFIKEGNIGVSNHHVFAGGKQWFIKANDGKQYQVDNILAESQEFDYVVFHVRAPKQFPYLKIATSSIEKGDDVIVIGNPKGLEYSLTTGVVSAIRSQTKENDVIQISAAISHGSSGSPVMNTRGEVIGYATLKIIDCENCNIAFNIKLLGF